MTGTWYTPDTPQLDHNTALILFFFTVLIHAATMFFLESVSSTFQVVISATRGNTAKSKTGSGIPGNVSTSNVGTVASLITHTQYRPLSSTLDVSIFR